MDYAELNKCIRESKLKIEDIYTHIGICRMSWYNKINGRRLFTIDEFNDLCDYLKISDAKKLKIMR